MPLIGNFISLNKVGGPAGGAGPSVNYPADLYPNMSFAYGFTKAASAYSGSCMQVQRSSDGEYMEVGWINDYYADLQSILDWAGTDTVRVTIIYDTTGNGNNAYMNTEAQQCRIADAGSLTLYNKGLRYYWNGQRQRYNITNATNSPYNKSRLDTYLLHTRATSNNLGMPIGILNISINGGFVLLSQSSTQLPYYYVGTPTYYLNGNGISWPTRTSVFNSLPTGNLDQISILGATTNTAISSSVLVIGSTYDFNFSFRGAMQTHWGWTVDTSADREAIEALINETYTFDPLNPFP